MRAAHNVQVADCPYYLSLYYAKVLFGMSMMKVCFFFTSCRDLDLKRPIYQKTACYGHFGRPEFSMGAAESFALLVSQ
jgi:hypothetical protein